MSKHSVKTTTSHPQKQDIVVTKFDFDQESKLIHDQIAASKHITSLNNSANQTLAFNSNLNAPCLTKTSTVSIDSISNLSSSCKQLKKSAR